MVKKQTHPVRRRQRLMAAALVGFVGWSLMSIATTQSASASVPTKPTVRVAVGDQPPMSAMGIRW